MAKPVTKYMESTLRSLRDQPFPMQEINAGARWRLEKSGYIETVRLPSPYKIHRGADIDFAKITDKGRRFLEDGI